MYTDIYVQETEVQILSDNKVAFNYMYTDIYAHGLLFQ